MEQKLREQMAAFQRRADREPWLPWLGVAPFFDVGGCVLMIVSFIAIWNGLLLFYVSLGIGIACSVVGFRDDGIRRARRTRDGLVELKRRLRDRETEFFSLKLEIMEILIENQDVFPDMEDPIEILYTKTMKGVIEMLEDARELAEEVKADDGMPEYAQELAKEVLAKLKRMRELDEALSR